MRAMLRGEMRDARAWAKAAIWGIVLYLAIDVALVFLRPQFSVLHNAESDYGSKGRYSWVMDANFLLRCALSLATIQALRLAVPARRLRAGLALIAVWALGSGLLAFFPDDPVGTKTHGLAKVHLVLAAVAFLGIVLGTRVATSSLRRERAWGPVVAPLIVLSWGALVPVLLLGKAHLRPHSLGGLWEKVFLGIELAWLLVAALWVARGDGGRASPERVSGAAA
jgi:hypothetical membrane protein